MATDQSSRLLTSNRWVRLTQNCAEIEGLAVTQDARPQCWSHTSHQKSHGLDHPGSSPKPESQMVAPESDPVLGGHPNQNRNFPERPLSAAKLGAIRLG